MTQAAGLQLVTWADSDSPGNAAGFWPGLLECGPCGTWPGYACPSGVPGTGALFGHHAEYSGGCTCGLVPLARAPLHEQACPTSRCGPRRLGSDPSAAVECTYRTVDVAAVQLNLSMDPRRHLPAPY